MKKLITFVLFLFAIYGFCSHTNNVQVNKSCIELYNVLKNEDFGKLDSEKILYVDIGIDYIPYELIELFEKLSGVRVIVDVFDSNEILEAKLLAGGAQYDIVFPTAWPNFSRQLNAGIYQRLDKKRINYEIFDKDILERLAKYDVENQHAVPYQFGISGIGISEKVLQLLEKDKNAPIDSYALIFDPKYAEILSKYRISVYESPNELFPAVMAYLGLDPESEKEEDIQKAAEQLKKVRPYISKFTAYGFEDLASENACAVLSTSGDILKSGMTNKNAGIKFVFPKEGASLWVDVAAIPMQARHVNNAYAFFKFLFHPQVIAYVTNSTSRANAVTTSAKFVRADLLKNENIYPAANTRKKCYIEKPSSAKVESLKTRLLTIIKSDNKVM